MDMVESTKDEIGIAACVCVCGGGGIATGA
jgi:hypothetical protein